MRGLLLLAAAVAAALMRPAPPAAVREQPLRNVYGDPLEPCRRIPGDQRGSWDAEGRCSEMGGGVHQICMRMTGDFSVATGQSDWSKSRAHTTHCACLGAWALYAAQDGAADLECAAIPEASLSARYVGRWSTWNGRELPDQIRHGVEELKRQCLAQQQDAGKRRHLRSLADRLLQRGR